MTIINQNSISGITSITAASGSVQIFNSDGSSGSLTDLSGVNVVGVVTATSFVGDGSNLTGIDSIVTGNTSVQTVDTGSDGHIKFNTEGSEVARFDSSGRFGVGTASPGSNLHVEASATSSASIVAGDTTSNSNLQFGDQDQINVGLISYNHTDNVLWFRTNGSGEDMRIDSSGRLLVGTTSAPTNSDSLVVFQGLAGNATEQGIMRLQRSANNGSNNLIGVLEFGGTDGASATIAGVGDGTWGTNDYPGRLVFSTTADGASSPTERMRIDSSGNVGIGITSPRARLSLSGASGTNGINLYDNGGNYRTGIGGDQNSLRFYFPSNGSGGIQFGTLSVSDGSTFSESARFDSAGRLLIGTSSPRTNFYAGTYTPTLQVETANASGGRGLAVINNTSSDGSTTFILAKSNGTAVGSNTAVSDTNHLVNISFQGNDGTNFAEAAAIDCYVAGSPGTNSIPGTLVFRTTSGGATSPTQRMRITASGNPGFGNMSYLFPETDNAISIGLNGYRWSAIWAANGTIQTSDQRAKTEIADAQLGSNFIKSLRPVSYKWIEGGKRDTGERDEDNNYIYESVPGTRTHWGFIAQEVKQAVDDAGVDFGGWVLTDKDDPDSEQALRYDQFIAPLTKALQEALAKIETLETANASQATTIAALDARLTTLEGG